MDGLIDWLIDWLIVSKLLLIIGPIFAVAGRVPLFNALVWGEPLNRDGYCDNKLETSLYRKV